MAGRDDHGTAAPPAASTRGLRIAAVIAAVVAVLSTSVFAVLALESHAGATSPEDAASDLFLAAVSGDVLGLLSVLPPSERDALVASVPEVSTQLERLGLITHFDGHVVPGAELSVDSVRFRTERLADGIVAVDVVAGRLTLDAVDDKLPLTEESRRILGNDFGVHSDRGTAVRDFAQYPLRLVAVEENRAWHISLAYSLGENLRLGAGAPTPTFAAGPAIRGASTPDGVVRDLIEATANGDAARAIGQLLPHEAQALHDYAALLVPPDPAAVAERNKGKDPRAIPLSDRLALTSRTTVDRLDLSASGSGATRRVRITALEVTVADEVLLEHLTYDGACLVADYRFAAEDPPFASFSSCGTEPTESDKPAGNEPAVTRPSGTASRTEPDTAAGETEAEREREQGGGHPPADNLFSRAAVFGAGGGELPTFTVVERDGVWFVSPVRTVIDSLLDTMRAIPPDATDAALARLRRAFDVPGREVEDEAKDPDNSLFGPGAVAKNRLVAACFVEVLRRAGDGAMATHGPECVRHLIADGRVRGDAIGPLLLSACYTAEPAAPPALEPPFRRIYLAGVAVRACVQRAVDAGEVPDYLVQDLLAPAPRACFGPYEKLDRLAAEADWAAADPLVTECVSRVTSHSPADSGTAPPR